jgi:hypothetical protein
VAIGDHKFVCFSIDVARETRMYVQFWSEPLEPVLWEVSSGKWNRPADKWLAGERSERVVRELTALAEAHRSSVRLGEPLIERRLPAP